MQCGFKRLRSVFEWNLVRPEFLHFSKDELNFVLKDKRAI